MKRYWELTRFFLIASVIMLCFQSMAVLAEEKQPGATGISQEEALRLGERIYREGILPSGEPVEAIVKGDITVQGSMFSCQSCHMRSGLGSFEGGVVTPPTNAAKLFKPLEVHTAPVYTAVPLKPKQIDEQNQEYYRTPHARPVYTDASLSVALQSGVDSGGRVMSDVMPRYLLDDKDMKLLIAYLRSLSSELSPGVSDKTIRFATIIAEDVSPDNRNAMLVPLENFIKNWNETIFLDPRVKRSRSTGYRSRQMADITLTPLGVALRKLELSRWVLKGSPETWRSQLEEYYRKEPVFAFAGGITNGEWKPIHQFCEDNHIPDIFPITDYPVISRSDWYTLYLSKGYYQEGEGAARFLNYQGKLKGKPILQIVRDTPEGRALSRGFQETWSEFGQKEPKTVTVKADETLTKEFLQQKLAQGKPAAILLWDGPESLKTLELLAAMKKRPAMVLVSSSFLGKSMLSLNKQARHFTYLTYPYGVSRSPKEKKPVYAMTAIKNYNPEANADARTRIGQQAYILTTVLNMAIPDMKGNYYRDNLLDVIGMIMDQDVPLYERLSFGPGQRYASKGCYIVQLSTDDKPTLIKKSSWVIH